MCKWISSAARRNGTSPAKNLLQIFAGNASPHHSGSAEMKFVDLERTHSAVRRIALRTCLLVASSTMCRDARKIRSARRPSASSMTSVAPLSLTACVWQSLKKIAENVPQVEPAGMESVEKGKTRQAVLRIT